MDEVQHFTYGWLNPAFAYTLSVVGSLVGLNCTAKARASADRRQRAWLLVFAAGAIGGTGIWVMHFMAMIGFSVPGAALRYDVGLTVASFLIAMVVVGFGLFIVGYGKPSHAKLLVGGVITGVSVAFMHYTGMAAVRFNGHLTYDTDLVVASYVVAVVAATVALWFTVVVSSPRAIVGASSIMGLAVCGMHYLGMAAVRVDVVEHFDQIPGVAVNWFLFPIVVFVLLAVVAAVVGAMLADTSREEFDAVPPRELASPTVDLRAAALAGVSSRYVPRSTGAGSGVWAGRGYDDGRGARPPRR